MRTRSSCFWPNRLINTPKINIHFVSNVFPNYTVPIAGMAVPTLHDVALTKQTTCHVWRMWIVWAVAQWDSIFIFKWHTRSNDKVRKKKPEKRPPNQSPKRNKSLCPIIDFLFDGHLEMTENEMNHRYILMADAAAAPFGRRQCDFVDR